MSQIEQYDAVVVGTGEAGKWIAWHLGASGKRVIAVERGLIGGACPNVACLPSKNVIHTAKVTSYLRDHDAFGLRVTGFSVDMAGVRARKRRMVDAEHQFHVDRFAQAGVPVLYGPARFVGPKTLAVALPDGSTRTLRGEQVFLDTGTRATVDPIPGMAEAAPMTHVEALELGVVPERLLVLGGGYVGLELAQALRRFGGHVTVLERSARLLPREDPDVAEAVAKLFADEGIEVVGDAQIARVEGRSGERVRLAGRCGGTERSFEGTHLLVSTGRTPNTDGMGLDVGGVETNERGFIKVNERLETTAPGVWATGDCTGAPFFTHISFDDFHILRDNLAGGNRVTTGRQVPFCLFIDPELARVGMDETQARAARVPYRVAKLPMAGVLRAHTLDETRGFLKVLVGATDDKVLGFVGFGYGAGELLPVMQLAMRHGLPYTAVRDLILAHPTMNEAFAYLLSSPFTPGKP